jgi:hypothetical protein
MNRERLCKKPKEGADSCLHQTKMSVCCESTSNLQKARVPGVNNSEIARDLEIILKARLKAVAAVQHVAAPPRVCMHPQPCHMLAWWLDEMAFRQPWLIGPRWRAIGLPCITQDEDSSVDLREADVQLQCWCMYDYTFWSGTLNLEM